LLRRWFVLKDGRIFWFKETNVTKVIHCCTPRPPVEGAGGFIFNRPVLPRLRTRSLGV